MNTAQQIFQSDLKEKQKTYCGGKQRKYLRFAHEYLQDYAPYSRKKRLLMAMWHCFLGLFFWFDP